MNVRGTMAAALAAGGLLVLVSACGSGDDTTEANVAADAKAAPTLEEARGAKGSITFCAAKDLSGDFNDVIARFNERHRSQGLEARLFEFPESADEQRNQFVQRQEAGSGECDVFWADVIWTAEFTAQGWLLDMTDYVTGRKGEFIPSTLETVEVGERYFGVPADTDAGLLYYRTDHVSEAPTTWQDLYDAAGQNDGIAYQGAPYEGLTVDFLELAFAAGGAVLSENGDESVIDSPRNRRALELMVAGVEGGAALRGVTTYKEEEARRAFEAGRVSFMRNWPYAYSLGNQAPKVRGRFAVAPLPGFEGAGRAGVLGGHNAVISRFSKNPEGAVAFVDFFTSPEATKRRAVEYSRAPVLTATYGDPDVTRALPFAAELKQAVEQAKSRPVSPVYSQISQAIYKNVNAALAGQMSPAEALKKADEQITNALATF